MEEDRDADDHDHLMFHTTAHQDHQHPHHVAEGKTLDEGCSEDRRKAGDATFSIVSVSVSHVSEAQGDNQQCGDKTSAVDKETESQCQVQDGGQDTSADSQLTTDSQQDCDSEVGSQQNCDSEVGSQLTTDSQQNCHPEVDSQLTTDSQQNCHPEVDSQLTTDSQQNCHSEVGSQLITDSQQNCHSEVGSQLTTDSQQNCHPEVGSQLTTDSQQNCRPAVGSQLTTDSQQNCHPEVGSQLTTDSQQNCQQALSGSETGSGTGSAVSCSDMSGSDDVVVGSSLTCKSSEDTQVVVSELCSESSSGGSGEAEEGGTSALIPKVHTSEIHTLEMHTPVVHTLNIHTSEMHTSDSEKHTADIHTPDIHISEIHTPDIHTSDSEIHTPDIHTSDSEIHTPDIHTSDCEIHTPDIHTTGTHTPDSEVHSPEIHTSESESEMHTPNIHTPGTHTTCLDASEGSAIDASLQEDINAGETDPTQRDGHSDSPNVVQLETSVCATSDTDVNISQDAPTNAALQKDMNTDRTDSTSDDNSVSATLTMEQLETLVCATSQSGDVNTREDALPNTALQEDMNTDRTDSTPSDDNSVTSNVEHSEDSVCAISHCGDANTREDAAPNTDTSTSKSSISNTALPAKASNIKEGSSQDMTLSDITDPDTAMSVKAPNIKEGSSWDMTLLDITDSDTAISVKAADITEDFCRDMTLPDISDSDTAMSVKASNITEGSGQDMTLPDITESTVKASSITEGSSQDMTLTLPVIIDPDTAMLVKAPDITEGSSQDMTLPDNSDPDTGMLVKLKASNIKEDSDQEMTLPDIADPDTAMLVKASNIKEDSSLDVTLPVTTDPNIGVCVDGSKGLCVSSCTAVLNEGSPGGDDTAAIGDRESRENSSSGFISSQTQDKENMLRKCSVVLVRTQYSFSVQKRRPFRKNSLNIKHVSGPSRVLGKSSKRPAAKSKMSRKSGKVLSVPSRVLTKPKRTVKSKSSNINLPRNIPLRDCFVALSRESSLVAEKLKQPFRKNNTPGLKRLERRTQELAPSRSQHSANPNQKLLLQRRYVTGTKGILPLQDCFVRLNRNEPLQRTASRNNKQPRAGAKKQSPVKSQNIHSQNKHRQLRGTSSWKQVANIPELRDCVVVLNPTEIEDVVKGGRKPFKSLSVNPQSPALAKRLPHQLKSQPPVGERQDGIKDCVVLLDRQPITEARHTASTNIPSVHLLSRACKSSVGRGTRSSYKLSTHKVSFMDCVVVLHRKELEGDRSKMSETERISVDPHTVQFTPRRTGDFPSRKAARLAHKRQLRSREGNSETCSDFQHCSVVLSRVFEPVQTLHQASHDKPYTGRRGRPLRKPAPTPDRGSGLRDCWVHLSRLEDQGHEETGRSNDPPLTAARNRTSGLKRHGLQMPGTHNQAPEKNNQVPGPVVKVRGRPSKKISLVQTPQVEFSVPHQSLQGPIMKNLKRGRPCMSLTRRPQMEFSVHMQPLHTSAEKRRDTATEEQRLFPGPPSPQPVRKRGRFQEIPKWQSVVASEVLPVSGLKGPVKKRGRPPRIPKGQSIVTSEVLPWQSHVASYSDSDVLPWQSHVAPVLPVSELTVPVKKRGRHGKLHQGQSVVSETAKTSTMEDPAKKRQRLQETGHDAASELFSLPEMTPPAKKRGRPRKKLDGQRVVTSGALTASLSNIGPASLTSGALPLAVSGIGPASQHTPVTLHWSQHHTALPMPHCSVVFSDDEESSPWSVEGREDFTVGSTTTASIHPLPNVTASAKKKGRPSKQKTVGRKRDARTQLNTHCDYTAAQMSAAGIWVSAFTEKGDCSVTSKIKNTGPRPSGQWLEPTSEGTNLVKTQTLIDGAENFGTQLLSSSGGPGKNAGKKRRAAKSGARQTPKRKRKGRMTVTAYPEETVASDNVTVQGEDYFAERWPTNSGARQIPKQKRKGGMTVTVSPEETAASDDVMIQEEDFFVVVEQSDSEDEDTQEKASGEAVEEDCSVSVGLDETDGRMFMRLLPSDDVP